MSADIQRVFANALALPPEDRATLADMLLASLDQSDPVEISEAWAIELRRRVKELDDGTAEAIPAEEVFREIDKRFT